MKGAPGDFAMARANPANGPVPCENCGFWLKAGSGPLCLACDIETSPPAPQAQGKKADTGKPAMDLIDPWFVEDVAAVLTSGAMKYDKNQWQGGMAIGKALAAALRHTYAVLKGEYIDPESGNSHLAHATCELMFVHFFIRKGMTNVPDDRFKK